MAPDRCVDPRLAAGTGDAFLVEVARDGARADAGGEVAEDAVHDIGLGLVDLPIAPDRLALVVELLDDLVAVAEPAARLAVLDAPAQAAMRLGGKVLQE